MDLKEFDVSADAKQLFIDSKEVAFENDGKSIKFNQQKINNFLVIEL